MRQKPREMGAVAWPQADETFILPILTGSFRYDSALHVLDILLILNTNVFEDVRVGLQGVRESDAERGV